MGKKYYKIIFSPFSLTPVGTIVNTDDKINNDKIKRFTELKPLNELIYNYSEKYNIPIHCIISFLDANYFQRKRLKIEEEHRSTLYLIKRVSKKKPF